MNPNKPNITFETEGERYEQFPEQFPRELNIPVGNCCAVAKSAWIKKVSELETQLIRDTTDNMILHTLNPNHLDCKNFGALLKELYELQEGQDAVFTVNKIIGRYFRIDKLKTSLLKHVAEVARLAAKTAIAAWLYCNRTKHSSNWYEQLRRDEK